MAPKIYIRTFGCQMNEYDSTRILAALGAGAPVEQVAHPEAADIVIYNTCSIREKAEEKVFHDLGRVREIKKYKPQLIIAVGGCVASQEGAAIMARAPYVDVIFGPQTLHRLPQLIRERRALGKAQIDVSFPEIEKFDALPPAQVTGSAANVSVMEGCSKYCSFCIVPYTRGEELSRPLADVLQEVQNLVAQGVREVTLLGQNVNAYNGVFAMEKAEKNSADLALLIETIAAIRQIERIRFMTSHPVNMSRRLIESFATVPKLAAHLHLPVQSGSDKILVAMKRGYSVAYYKDLVAQLRAAQPRLALSSDFIVGFPGETEEDFQATLQLIDEVGFCMSFSFLYSPRPGTPAADLADSTPLGVKQERLLRLQARLAGHEQRWLKTMVGKVERVRVENFARKNSTELSGRISSNHVVNFAAPLSDAPMDSSPVVSSPDVIGSFLNVRIVSAMSHSLRGVVLQEESATAVVACN